MRYYYSGAQSKVTIGNHVVDELVEIEFTYNVDKVPIWSYASHLYNASSKGHVYGMGSLTLNYVYDGYIYQFLDGKNGDNEAFAKLAVGQSKFGIPTSYEPDATTKAIMALTGITEEDMGSVFSGAEIPNIHDSYKADGSGIRPEMLKAFDITINDYKVSFGNNSNPQTKTLSSAEFTKNSTVRRPDGTPLAEVYSFVFRQLI